MYICVCQHTKLDPAVNFFILLAAKDSEEPGASASVGQVNTTEGSKKQDNLAQKRCKEAAQHTHIVYPSQ